MRASKVINGPQKEPFNGDKKQFIDDLEQALYASKIISYTQGFMLMRETAKEVSNVLVIKVHTQVWNLDELELELRWYCPDVARRMHHQGTPHSNRPLFDINFCHRVCSLVTLLLPTRRTRTLSPCSSMISLTRVRVIGRCVWYLSDECVQLSTLHNPAGGV